MKFADAPGFPGSDHQEPIRAELFSIERLEQHGQSLAAAQAITTESRKGRWLSPRVRDNARILRDSYRAIAEAIRDERSITPAAEWFVDNFHIVEEQLREIREDLPPGYYRDLPKLAAGHLKDYPRVFGLAWAFVAHTDSQFDPEALLRFVRSYQRVQPLTIGELWAIAITLRVVLIENLRRLAERVVAGRKARQEADALADRLLGLEVGAKAGEDLLADLARHPLPRAFAVQLVQRMRDQDPAVTPALRWLDERLAEQNTTPDEIVRAEHQAQAAMNLTVRNVITSMRLISAFDWMQFFEDVSLVDEALRDGSDFAEMDFSTRDRYRHAIEDLSRGSGLTELEVTRRVLERARLSNRSTNPMASLDGGMEHDPGYYLISKGRATFERQIRYRIPLSRRFIRLYVAGAAPSYVATIVGATASVLGLSLFGAAQSGTGARSLLLLGLLGLVPASHAAIALVNRFVAGLIVPRHLPRLELKSGVPESLRTLVAVPTLLTTEREVEELIERLEVHYLANPEGGLRFALLTDWMDAREETLPADDPLLEVAALGIARLNERYGLLPEGGQRFFLFHRKRIWNERQGRWMGWERKRGKLHELNRMLMGAGDTSFVPVGGLPLAVPSGIRYVITLDADTRLPRGAATKLVGTMAHPLNRPKFDPRLRRVVDGYGVLQPRITPDLPAHRERSLYRRISSGPSGIDPYASAVSDVYQDLFGEGSYAGKGIYDVEAFEASLAGRAPENALLSHDLFEGVFVRAAFVADIELIENFPSQYEVAAARQHRWARGDWQLLPWILGIAPDAEGRLRRARLLAIGRWKMLDNLRRTLFPPATFLALVTGWLICAAPALWTASVLAMIAVPAFVPIVDGLLPRRSGISKRSHLVNFAKDTITAFAQVCLTVALLAHQAWLMADAIIRTLVRLFVTRRKLLEWVTEAQTRSRFGFEAAGLWRMSGAVALAFLAACAVSVMRAAAWPSAMVPILLWAGSPWIARRISLPPRTVRTNPLSADERRLLRSAARRTWRFFETFVGREDNHLPPDNYQQDPKPTVAHRTSPTNIGLYLLSIVAARDFGWLGLSETIDRLEATLGTMRRLERLRGHYYNWYDTRDLRPLDPRYVSSVDSGNLTGHLIALAQACREMARRPLFGPCTLEG
ncbi:MAG: glycosyl transferase, partial [Acidobacteria bacterium]